MCVSAVNVCVCFSGLDQINSKLSVQFPLLKACRVEGGIRWNFWGAGKEKG